LSLDIPAQPLSMALAAFADQTRLPLVYVSTIGEGRVSHKAQAGIRQARTLSAASRPMDTFRIAWRVTAA
jgi:hypothetical protein